MGSIEETVSAAAMGAIGAVVVFGVQGVYGNFNPGLKLVLTLTRTTHKGADDRLAVQIRAERTGGGRIRLSGLLASVYTDEKHDEALSYRLNRQLAEQTEEAPQNKWLETASKRDLSTPRPAPRKGSGHILGPGDTYDFVAHLDVKESSVIEIQTRLFAVRVFGSFDLSCYPPQWATGALSLPVVKP